MRYINLHFTYLPTNNNCVWTMVLPYYCVVRQRRSWAVGDRSNLEVDIHWTSRSYARSRGFEQLWAGQRRMEMPTTVHCLNLSIFPDGFRGQMRAELTGGNASDLRSSGRWFDSRPGA